jgi:hypothetical protein
MKGMAHRGMKNIFKCTSAGGIEMRGNDFATLLISQYFKEI